MKEGSKLIMLRTKVKQNDPLVCVCVRVCVCVCVSDTLIPTGELPVNFGDEGH